MKKQKRKRTAAEKAERKRRQEEFTTIFIGGKQKRVRRPQTIDGMLVDEFICRNADPVRLHQNEMWEKLHEREMAEILDFAEVAGEAKPEHSPDPRRNPHGKDPRWRSGVAQQGKERKEAQSREAALAFGLGEPLEEERPEEVWNASRRSRNSAAVGPLSSSRRVATRC